MRGKHARRAGGDQLKESPRHGGAALDLEGGCIRVRQGRRWARAVGRVGVCQGRAVGRCPRGCFNRACMRGALQTLAPGRHPLNPPPAHVCALAQLVHQRQHGGRPPARQRRRRLRHQGAARGGGWVGESEGGGGASFSARTCRLGPSSAAFPTATPFRHTPTPKAPAPWLRAPPPQARALTSSRASRRPMMTCPQRARHPRSCAARSG